MAATPAQDGEAQDGYVVVPANRLFALRTMRARLRDAAMFRQARDTDIEEAPEEQAQQKRRKLEGEKRWH